MTNNIETENFILEKNNALIKEVQEKGFLKSPAITEGFRRARRHLFIENFYVREGAKWAKLYNNPKNPEPKHCEIIYKDQVIPVRLDVQGKVQNSSSMPTVMAMMLEELGLREGMTVFELGAGTGYNASIMAEIVGKNGYVVTTEILSEDGNLAKKHLEDAGYSDRVTAIIGDGGFGYAERAPYDRIIVTAGCSDISPHWLSELKDGGILVLPLATRGKEVLFRVERRGNDFYGRFSYSVVFVDLGGKFSSYGHTFYTSANKALEGMIARAAPIESEYAKQALSLERKERNDFEFFLSISEPNAVAYMDLAASDLKTGMGFGLWDRSEFKKSGIILTFHDRILAYGFKDNVCTQFETAFKKWRDLGNPKITDYEVLITTADKPLPYQPNSWIIERRLTKQRIFLKT